jgi:hypothetical protein
MLISQEKSNFFEKAYVYCHKFLFFRGLPRRKEGTRSCLFVFSFVVLGGLRGKNDCIRAGFVGRIRKQKKVKLWQDEKMSVPGYFQKE